MCIQECNLPIKVESAFWRIYNYSSLDNAFRTVITRTIYGWKHISITKITDPYG